MTPPGDQWACDTSIAVAALDPNHAAHTTSRRAVVALRPALAGHAIFETYAVLTRLPIPLRVSPERATAAIAGAFELNCWLPPGEAGKLFDRLPALGIVGGSVYDALIGAAAASAGRRLLTRDRRAERTYAALGVGHRFVD